MEVRISDLFDLQKITDSGQCFRVALLPGGTYRFITGGNVLYIRKAAEETYEVSCDQDTWERIWSPYFDLAGITRTFARPFRRKIPSWLWPHRPAQASEFCGRTPGRCWLLSSFPSAKASRPSVP